MRSEFDKLMRECGSSSVIRESGVEISDGEQRTTGRHGVEIGAGTRRLGDGACRISAAIERGVQGF